MAASPLSFLDSVLDSLLPHILGFDWTIVHLIIAFPFLLILFNFLNGGCDVADSAGLYQPGASQDEDEVKHEAESNEHGKFSSLFSSCSFSYFFSLLDNPRLSVALMILAFFWQIHAVWFVAFRYLNQSIDLSTSVFRGALRQLLNYLLMAHAATCLGYLLCCIVVWKRAVDERRECGVSTHKQYIAKYFPLGKKNSNNKEKEKVTTDVQNGIITTQRGGADENTHKNQRKEEGEEKEEEEEVSYSNPKLDTIRISFCRRCKTAIVGRDHHCRWLGVCIGARTRVLYILSLVLGFFFAFIDVIIGAFTIPILNDLASSPTSSSASLTVERYYILAGYFLAIGAACFLVYQTGVQLNLLRVGQTKVGRKGRRELFEKKKKRKAKVEMVIQKEEEEKIKLEDD